MRAGFAFVIFALVLAHAVVAENFIYSQTINGTGNDYGDVANKFESAMSLWVDNGTLYVADPVKGFVMVLANNSVKQKISLFESGVTSTEKMEIWVGDGRVYYTEPELAKARYYTGSSTEVSKPEMKNYERPVGICVDNDTVYVTDIYGNSIYSYNKTTRSIIGVFGTGGTFNDQFLKPSGIFVANDLIYIVDTDNSRIQVYRKNWTLYDTIGKGRGDVLLDRPEGVFVSDKIYVADTGNNRVVVFNMDGYPAATLGGDPDEERKQYMLEYPHDVFVYGDRLYVANDSGDVLVYKLNLSATSNPAVLAKINLVNASVVAFEALATQARSVGVNMTTGARVTINAAGTAYAGYKYIDAAGMADDANRTVVADMANLTSGIQGAVATIISSSRTKLAGANMANASAALNQSKKDAETALNASEQALIAKNYPEAMRQAVSGRDKANALVSSLQNYSQQQQDEEMARQKAAVLSRMSELNDNYSALNLSAAAANKTLQLSVLDALIAKAQAELDANRTSDANDTVTLAFTEIGKLNSNLGTEMGDIETTWKEITRAEEMINESESKGTIVHPDLTKAKKLLAEAKAKLKSDPGGAKTLAEQAQQEVQARVAENEKMDLAAIVIAAVAAGLVVALVVLVIIGAGAGGIWLWNRRKRGL